MIAQLLKIGLVLNIIPLAVAVDLDEEGLERFNSDYNRISLIREEANPELEEIESLVSSSQQQFLEKIKSRVSKEEFSKIKKDFSFISSTNADEIDKKYLAKIEAVEKTELSKDTQKSLTDLMTMSNNHLQSGINFKEIIRKNLSKSSPKQTAEPATFISEKTTSVPNEAALKKEERDFVRDYQQAQTEENNKIKRIQKETLEHVKRSNKNNLRPTETDSLFKKVSKAYLRNIQKVIIEED